MFDRMVNAQVFEERMKLCPPDLPEALAMLKEEGDDDEDDDDDGDEKIVGRGRGDPLFTPPNRPHPPLGGPAPKLAAQPSGRGRGRPPGARGAPHVTPAKPHPASNNTAPGVSAPASAPMPPGLGAASVADDLDEVSREDWNRRLAEVQVILLLGMTLL